mmetsp:Transcript_26710/g.76453  ORF Transcript_26710/g.76453 Transcript_26710/m.76453 type:complete len:228 (-) Transcript_26710:264-947(-)
MLLEGERGQLAVDLGGQGGALRELASQPRQPLLHLPAPALGGLHCAGVPLGARLDHAHILVEVVELRLQPLRGACALPNVRIVRGDAVGELGGMFFQGFDGSSLLVEAILDGIQLQAPPPLLRQHAGLRRAVGLAGLEAAVLEQPQLLRLQVQGLLHVFQLGAELALSTPQLQNFAVQPAPHLIELRPQLLHQRGRGAAADEPAEVLFEVAAGEGHLLRKPTMQLRA